MSRIARAGKKLAAEAKQSARRATKRPSKVGNPNEVLPYEAVLGRLTVVRKDGRAVQVSAEEALLLKVSEMAERDHSLQLMLVDHIEQIEAIRGPASVPTTLYHYIIRPGSVDTALEPLRMAKKFNKKQILGQDDEKATYSLLEPWVIEAALARLGESHLSEDDQRVVFAATRTPHKVKWPAWWTVHKVS